MTNDDEDCYDRNIIYTLKNQRLIVKLTYKSNYIYIYIYIVTIIITK